MHIYMYICDVQMYGEQIYIWCAYIWFINMKTSFPKYDKRHSKQIRVCNANAMLIDCALNKSSVYIYIYISMYVCTHINTYL